MTELVTLREAVDTPATATPGPCAMRKEKLNAFFGSVHAVRDVSLDVPANQVTAIIGPSGCGKSTLLRTLNRMHETSPTARVTGRVFFHDQDIYADGVNPITPTWCGSTCH